MDTLETRELAKKARRAYEVGRIRRSICRVWPVAPIACVAVVASDATVSAILAVVLAGCAATLIYLGRGLDRAVESGFKAGLIPMVVALAMWQGQGCSGPAGSWCVPLCAGPSVVVGAWLAFRLGRSTRPAHGAAALVIAALTASLGCAVLGMGSLLGVGAGLLLGMAPAWALSASRA